MKRPYIVSVILCLCLVAVSAYGLSETALPDAGQPLYEAFSKVEFHIRKEPKDNARRIKEVAKHETLLVYEYDEEWCKVGYEKAIGYCKTRWLYLYRSLQPEKAKVPGYPVQAGVAKVLSPIHASVHGYGGNDLQAGDTIAIHQWEEDEATIHMMRDVTTISAASLEFTPFVAWDNAKAGELIGGFTTYYNEKTGGRLSENRRLNIEVACQRIHNAVISAGESFSYNALCAPYTKGNGYKMAPNISSEGQGYGGGVCQLSTTVYNAILGLPLQIDEWAIHRDAGVPYIPKSFDAAVGSYSDLIFSNTLPYDIRLEAIPQNGALTVLIFRHAT